MNRSLGPQRLSPKGADYCDIGRPAGQLRQAANIGHTLKSLQPDCPGDLFDALRAFQFRPPPRALTGRAPGACRRVQSLFFGFVDLKHSGKTGELQYLPDPGCQAKQNELLALTLGLF